MSCPQAEAEDEMDEVEFVSEGPVRPVLECIDLRSDSDDELEDDITCHKSHVTSTLERLAQQVAQEKEERANKCRAFKEKQLSQRAHGQQELAFSSTSEINQEAKRCVDMWLKMPAVGAGSRKRSASFSTKSSSRLPCPVINCGRVFDNPPLLDGHLKRFDHSPCDPTIHLKGCPSELFACAACGQNFQTKVTWRKHLESKASSNNPEGHSVTQTYQRIVCFACPACYLFFNLRDECLQHMAAKNHFTEALTMTETKGKALPVPIPQYVKNRLITLCKDIVFHVRCSLCHKVLISHQAAQAHFNVQCRHGCAVAKADKTVAQVMAQLQVRGQCSLCYKLFFNQAEIDRHKDLNQHDVEVNQTMVKAVLQHCRFSESQHKDRFREEQERRQSIGLESPFQKKNKKRSNFEELPARRQTQCQSGNDSPAKKLTTAWYCECGLQFMEEAAASKHILAVNQIFHQCGVCGKHMGESSITRLHMSRFHGGAHLSNFLFYCRKCKIEMPRYEDILSHVSERHSGHTYFTEQEVPEELAAILDAKPSTSQVSLGKLGSTSQQNTVEMSSVRAKQTWMCRMCEEVFDLEKEVLEHCRDLSSHSFQRFMCGHCPQKFFKESTVRRHCINEHNGEIKSFHFCGLCDSMQFDTEDEFLGHYKKLHSKDYYCMNDDIQPTVAENISQPTCTCMGSEKSKEEARARYTQCMRDLTSEGKIQYVCAPCSVCLPSYAQMKTHVHTKHPALNLDTTFQVECKGCMKSFTDVPSFHEHYHAEHCTLEPCLSSRTPEPSTLKVLNPVEIKPDTNEIDDETLGKFLDMNQTVKESEVTKDELDEVISMSGEEARESADLEEALKRSLVEY